MCAYNTVVINKGISPPLDFLAPFLIRICTLIILF